MFGISFSELLLVGLVALLVLGPERLPGAARTAGLWVGRLKRSFNAIKQEVEREIGADEIRRQLHNEHILSLEEEARKIMQPQRPSTPPAPQPAPEAEQAPAGSLAASEQVIMVEKPSLTPEPAAEPASAPTPTTTQATAAPGTPSANDSTQPPRAP
ncbi:MULTISPECIES: Sec-independent protein translocase protein TatB [unclassified Pseudomonas]|uniref:Sec-independent protein translocase protein TatB n=1 Tax=unclassified Pseudomonas TaxID=196821 RepID=UPI000D38E496|nr:MULTISPECIES: Sec-independent protein translocase protein TatB [unclassified Pseudomonas]RAU46510.1 Sec-independent protein translocase subunit TatB [Pseudomonas sp. RIT 409]RAU52477.1 Sec-independent protein translocase subunit TatB [Pseudomonas sp. RIT 412]